MNPNQSAKVFRDAVYRAKDRKFLLTNFAGSDQEKDMSTSPNCRGYGRIRHFNRFISSDWSSDPLPIDPAQKILNLTNQDKINAQVFQIASCNLNCWYCFVPDSLKCADNNHAMWLSADEMIELYVEEGGGERVIDLSGGNPELVPEWIIDTMRALERHGLQQQVLLWSDDTLTTDFTFRFLEKADLEYMRSYKNYCRVCCFKGFDEHSFSYNTRLPEWYYDKQFENFLSLYKLGIDLYGYVTFTTDDVIGVESKIKQFIEKLQGIHPYLPLRIVPLKIFPFTPTRLRCTKSYEVALENQVIVNNAWSRQLTLMYSRDIRDIPICDIHMY